MNIFQQLVANDMLVCAVIAYFAAQILKIFTTLWRDGEFRFSTIVSSGGMPSSHSSTVVALAISCGRVYGVMSPMFAICFILAAIVMYDATGVRRAAGEQAKLLNHIVSDLFSGDPAYSEKALKELIGHTPLQVLMGALLGLLIGLFMPSLAPLVL